MLQGLHTILPLSTFKCRLPGKPEKNVCLLSYCSPAGSGPGQDQHLWTALSVFVCVRCTDLCMQLGLCLQRKKISFTLLFCLRQDKWWIVCSRLMVSWVLKTPRWKDPPYSGAGSHTASCILSWDHLGTTTLANRKLKPIWLNHEEPRPWLFFFLLNLPQIWCRDESKTFGVVVKEKELRGKCALPFSSRWRTAILNSDLQQERFMVWEGTSCTCYQKHTRTVLN